MGHDPLGLNDLLMEITEEHLQSLVLELALWSPFPMEGYLAQPRYSGEGLGPASIDVTDFVDSPWDASHSLRNRWEWGEQEEGREKELELVCKIRLL